MLKVVVTSEGMVVDEIAYRHQLIAKNTVAAKRARAAQDKRKREERVTRYQRRQD